MIAKQIKGRSFRGVLNYLDGKVGAQRIGGNMVGKTPAQLTAEFACSQQLNPTLRRAVYHVSLAVPSREAQSDKTWRAIAKDYLKGMNFQGSQHVVYRHTDTEHDHIHVVASRTRLTDGTTVSDSWDYKRSEALVRQLEKAYSLAAVESKDRGVRAQTTGEFRQRQATGEPSIREQLKLILQNASANNSTMPQFIKQVLAAGIEVKVSPGQNQIRGISYALGGIAFSGTHIGRDYTFPGLQKHRGIDYDSARDNEAITQLIEQGPQLHQQDDLALPVDLADEEATPQVPTRSTELQSVPENSAITKSIEATLETREIATEEAFEPHQLETRLVKQSKIDPLQKQCAEAIAPVAIAFFKLMQQNSELEQIDAERWRYQGDRYAMTYDKARDSFSVEALDGRGELIHLSQSQGHETVELAQGIGKEDIDSFYRMEQLLLQKESLAAKQIVQQIEAG